MKMPRLYPNCQKIIAFKLFENGLRPAQVYQRLTLEQSTLYRYFQEWKSNQINEKFKADNNRLQRQIRKWLVSLEKEIDRLHRYHETNYVQRIAKWQWYKRRAEELLRNPFSATPKERKMLDEYYD